MTWWAAKQESTVIITSPLAAIQGNEAVDDPPAHGAAAAAASAESGCGWRRRWRWWCHAVLLSLMLSLRPAAFHPVLHIDLVIIVVATRATTAADLEPEQRTRRPARRLLDQPPPGRGRVAA